MSDPNLHVETFLDYYYSFEKEPGYAVLLKGKWGTGKTWFVNKTLKKLEDTGGKYLYVSLYGVTTFDEIENEFFKQLHPLLSSKSMALTGKIAKGLLKATLKIDLDRDGTADGSLSTQIPTINLPEYLTNTSGFVIIFDDLERASINLESLLGYINHFVEHQGYKIIIVANEEEILKQQEKKDDFVLSYRRIKEKLIGKTFEIKPDLNGAMINFISEIKNDVVKNLYESKIEKISELYRFSLYQNLRHLKQALWDFERLVNYVNQETAKKEGLLEHLLKIFLILSFEIKSGNILPADISTIKAGYLSSLINRDTNKEEDTPYKKISNKYKNFILTDLLLEESIWVDFFDKGCCSSEKIQESLEKSEYFRTENTPDWVKLWHSMDLTDEEFSQALTSVENKFYRKEFTEIGEIKHIIGIFLWLSKIHLISKTTQEILDFSHTYMDHLKSSGYLTRPETSFLRKLSEHESWGGLGFHEKHSDEFRELIQYIDQLSEQAVLEKYPEAGTELLKYIDSDPELFYRKVVYCNHADNTYYETPIFTYIEPSLFVKIFTETTRNSKNLVCYAFSERYKYKNFNDSLASEIDWLNKVINLLEEKRQLLEGKISGYQLQSDINNYFKIALETLEKHKAKNP